MLPIRDDAPRYSTPYINYFLLTLNTIVFIVIWLGVLGPAQKVTDIWAFYPIKISAFAQGMHVVRVYHGVAAVNFFTAFVPILTAMFMHASWGHLIFNMWALYIFGDNIEDYLGHFRYLVFYLLCGVAGALLHTMLNLNSPVPSVGASGAIAGVMGAYFILYPSARVLTLVPIFFFFFVWLPAWIVLGFWFVGQFLSGAATAIAYSQQTGGGVAVWAHVGGFVAGVAMIKMFPTRPARYRYFYR